MTLISSELKIDSIICALYIFKQTLIESGLNQAGTVSLELSNWAQSTNKSLSFIAFSGSESKVSFKWDLHINNNDSVELLIRVGYFDDWQIGNHWVSCNTRNFSVNAVWFNVFISRNIKHVIVLIYFQQSTNAKEVNK